MPTEVAGTILFKHIFRIAPEALALFPFKDEEDIYSSPRFLGHATKVVSTVGVGARPAPDESRATLAS